MSNCLSMSSYIDSNAAHLAESIIADAEVYGSVRSSSKTFMGGRLDLLGDRKLYQQVEKQIRSQLSIALSTDKNDLLVGSVSGRSFPNRELSSGGVMNNESKIVRIKIRLRHDNIIVVDEFDYDISSSGLEGSDPFSIANSLVQDMRLPPELAPSIAATMLEQIYGVHINDSLDELTTYAALRNNPTALLLDTTREGSSSDFAQLMLSK